MGKRCKLGMGAEVMLVENVFCLVMSAKANNDAHERTPYHVDTFLFV